MRFCVTLLSDIRKNLPKSKQWGIGRMDYIFALIFIMPSFILAIDWRTKHLIEGVINDTNTFIAGDCRHGVPHL
jgi:hypothetical protein